MSWQDFVDRLTPTSVFETILIPLPRIEDGGSPSINLLAKELVFHTWKGLGEDVSNLKMNTNLRHSNGLVVVFFANVVTISIALSAHKRHDLLEFE